MAASCRYLRARGFGSDERYGIDRKLIDFGRKCEVDERDLLHEMLEFIPTEVDELGNHGEIAHIERIMREGAGADRQLMVWGTYSRHESRGGQHRRRNVRRIERRHVATVIPR
jgi:gamma-glutamyl:cysteine ligase YbdK (ATP-grasp superfamily)